MHKICVYQKEGGAEDFPKKLTDPIVGINTGELDGPIMSPPGIFLVFLVDALNVEPECQAIIHQVDTVCFLASTGQQVGAFDVSMDVLRFMEELECFKLERGGM